MTDWVGIKWVMEKTKIKSHATLKKNILIPFREELESFVIYPTEKGEPWLFERENMDKWIKTSPKKINDERRRRN